MAGKLSSRNSWRAKVEQCRPPAVVDVPPAQRHRWGGAKLLISSPKEIEAVVRGIRKGCLMTLDQLRSSLAKVHGADATCPLTTGIFLRIVAEAAEEDRHAGKHRITPYWRVIRGDGRLIDKFPGGASRQADLLQREGIHTEISPRTGKPIRVAPDRTPSAAITTKRKDRARGEED